MKDAGDGTHRAPIVYGRNQSSGVPNLTMFIGLKLFANVGRLARDGVPGKLFEMEISDGATVSDLATELNLPHKEVKVSFINGRAPSKDWILNPGDEVGIFPQVVGG